MNSYYAKVFFIKKGTAIERVITVINTLLRTISMNKKSKYCRLAIVNKSMKILEFYFYTFINHALNIIVVSLTLNRPPLGLALSGKVCNVMKENTYLYVFAAILYLLLKNGILLAISRINKLVVKEVALNVLFLPDLIFIIASFICLDVKKFFFSNRPYFYLEYALDIPLLLIFVISTIVTCIVNRHVIKEVYSNAINFTFYILSFMFYVLTVSFFF